jgi:HPt (histidine-containing phosphotransfer) domain-containing protein
MRMNPAPDADDLPPDPALDARLAELRGRFLQVLPQRIADVGAQLSRLGPGVWPAEAADRLQTEVHSLAGSCGLFGCDAVGAAAGGLEGLVRKARATPVTPAMLTELEQALAHLEESARATA